MRARSVLAVPSTELYLDSPLHAGHSLAGAPIPDPPRGRSRRPTRRVGAVSGARGLSGDGSAVPTHWARPPRRLPPGSPHLLSRWPRRRAGGAVRELATSLRYAGAPLV